MTPTLYRGGNANANPAPDPNAPAPVSSGIYVYGRDDEHLPNRTATLQVDDHVGTEVLEVCIDGPGARTVAIPADLIREILNPKGS